jgi:hypothetical protein
MDKTTPEPRRVELPHHRFADADEERRHVLRERVGFYVPSSEPWDLVLSRASHGELVQVRTTTLVALLDLLDHHGHERCEPLTTSAAKQNRELLEQLLWSAAGRKALEQAEAELLDSGTWIHPYDEDEEARS